MIATGLWYDCSTEQEVTEEKESKMRFMEVATIEQTLIEDRDDTHAECERLIAEGKFGTLEFHEMAKRYHRLAGQVGYIGGPK